jgi:hypothetical protein
VGDVIPFPIYHGKKADEIQDICIGCDQSFTRRSTPTPDWIGDFAFCSVECHSRSFTEGRLGMS